MEAKCTALGRKVLLSPLLPEVGSPHRKRLSTVSTIIRLRVQYAASSIEERGKEQTENA